MEIQRLYPAGCDGKVNFSKQVVVEEKLDGHRALLHIGKDLKRGFLTSKRDSVKTKLPCENGLNVPWITMAAQAVALQDRLGYTVLDGELIVPGYFREDVQTVMGSGTETAIEWQEKNEKARLTVFDVLFFDGVDMRQEPYVDRMDTVVEVVPWLSSKGVLVSTVGRWFVKEDSDIEAIFKEVVGRGGEGVIVKDLGAEYGKGWLKKKKEITYDVVVLGFTPGRNKYRELFGAVKFGLFTGKSEGSATRCLPFEQVGQCSGMPDGHCLWLDEDKNFVRPNAPGGRLVVNRGVEQPEGSRAWFHLLRGKLIGTVVEVKCNGLTKSGKMNHPRFIRTRPDKNPYECVELKE